MDTQLYLLNFIQDLLNNKTTPRLIKSDKSDVDFAELLAAELNNTEGSKRCNLIDVCSGIKDRTPDNKKLESVLDYMNSVKANGYTLQTISPLPITEVNVDKADIESVIKNNQSAKIDLDSTTLNTCSISELSVPNTFQIFNFDAVAELTTKIKETYQTTEIPNVTWIKNNGTIQSAKITWNTDNVSYQITVKIDPRTNEITMTLPSIQKQDITFNMDRLAIFQNDFKEHMSNTSLNITWAIEKIYKPESAQFKSDDQATGSQHKQFSQQKKKNKN